MNSNQLKLNETKPLFDNTAFNQVKNQNNTSKRLLKKEKIKYVLFNNGNNNNI